jgi:hypothetical protein
VRWSTFIVWLARWQILEVSVIGRVNNISLPVTKALLPVFEAIINSIQACSSNKKSDIDLLINRNLLQPSLSEEANFLPEVKGFVISDNGCGFNTKNFDSFNKSDTTNKIEIGGKGVGRFLWLKAFEHVSVDSIYIENNEKKKIHFEFSTKKDDGISELAINPIAESTPLTTKVKLVNISEKYSKYIPKETKTIAQSLFEYCLPYYINGAKLNINISDDNNQNEHFNLLDMYKELIQNNIEKETISIKSNSIDVYIIKYPTTSEANHRIIYCAHNREVKVEKLNKHIPLISQRLKDSQGNDFILMIYIIGKYFDEMVNKESTHFIFDEETDGDIIDYGQQELSIEGFPSLDQIRQEIIPIIYSHVEENIKDLKERHFQKIQSIVSETSPEYRSVIKYCENDIYKIPPNLNVENTEIELYKLRHRLELDIKRRNIKLLEKEPTNDEEMEDFIKEHMKIAEEITELGKDKLSDYVIQRHAIIKLFEARLKKRNDDRYPLEKAIHNIITPLKTTSDEIDYMNQNLWLIDERFTYHNYLASDENIKNGKKNKRPDLLIFNKTLAFTEDANPYQSIIIIEFKRPERNDYTDSENPFTQVFGYMDIILDNKAKDKDGRPIIIQETTRFYVYIICDITPKIVKLANDYSATKAPDDMGYFWFNTHYKAYMEVISFDKVLNDSKKRNRVLFEKLGLPDKI